MSRDCVFEKYEKNFLSNDKLEYGTMCWEVMVDRYDPEEPYNLHGNLRIQDCHETINLDFHIGKNKNGKLDRRLEKLDTMIEILKDMRDAIVEGGKLLEEKNKDIPEKKPKSKLDLLTEDDD